MASQKGVKNYPTCMGSPGVPSVLSCNSLLLCARQQKLPKSLRLCLFLCLLLSACTPALPNPKLHPTETENAQTLPATFTPQPTPSASPTPLIPLALLLAPEGADSSLVEAAGVALSNLSAQTGLRWELRASVKASDLTPDIRLILALPPASGLEELIQAGPEIQFLAIGIPGLSASPNLSRVGPEGGQPEEAAFLAGIIAAMITDEWRVGVISLSDTPAGVAARQAFLNGAVFFCGLCRQVYPPYYQYPFYVEFPSTASQAERLAAVAALVDRYVKTVYLYPGASDADLVNALAEAGIGIIGGASPAGIPPAQWVVTIQADPAKTMQDLLPNLLNGQGGHVQPVPLELVDINLELFSPGRQALAAKYLEELMVGAIETGINNGQE